jgi:5'-nucleotidase
MRLLLTNDDGIDAEGLWVMARAVSAWIANAPAGEQRSAVICAPHQNFSGMSAAVGDVYEHPDVPFRTRVIPGAENIAAYELSAPPALCAIIGGLGAFGPRPDLVLSGINPGANVGLSVLHSGTVGAVLTAAQLGISGLAVSVQWGREVHFDTAAALAMEVVEEILSLPSRVTLSLNVPNLTADAVKGIRRARISTAEVVAGAQLTPNEAGDAGTVRLVMGAASPTIGDVSNEESGDDGALVESGYGALTALQGPRDNSDLGLTALLDAAVTRMSAHLETLR